MSPDTLNRLRISRMRRMFAVNDSMRADDVRDRWNFLQAGVEKIMTNLKDGVDMATVSDIRCLLDWTYALAYSSS